MRPANASPAGFGSPRAFFEAHGTKLVLSLVFGGALAWILAQGGIPVVPPASALTEMAWWAVPGYAAVLAVSHTFRATRWRHLLAPLAPVPLRVVVGVSWVGFAAIFLAPLRSGEVVRPFLITRRAPVRLWEATATVGAERVIDAVTLSVMLLAGLAFGTVTQRSARLGDLPLPLDSVPRGAATAALVSFSALLVMGAFYRFRRQAHAAVFATVGVLSRPFAERLNGVLERMASGLAFLPRGRIVAPFLAESLLYWGTNSLGLWVLARAAGLEGVGYWEACVVMGCLGFGILVPSGPLFFGAFQLGVTLALALYVPEPVLQGRGAAYVFLAFVTQVLFNALAAAVGLVLSRTGNLARADAPT